MTAHSALETRIGVGLRRAAASGAGLGSGMTVITDSEVHVTDGALEVVPVLAGGMGGILRILPAPVFVAEDDQPSNEQRSSQSAHFAP